MISQTDLTPTHLFKEYEAGRITQEQLHKALEIQQRVLLQEVLEYRKNPVLAFLDGTLNRRAALKWKKSYGEKALREVLSALGEMQDFPPAIYIWNAGHDDVPLHCFFRVRREPVFRISHLSILPKLVEVKVEYGSAPKRKSSKEKITLRRGKDEKLVCVERQRLA